MKRSPLKLAAAVIAVLLIAGVAYYFFGTSARKQVQSSYVDPAFAEFVSSYSAGVIPAQGGLRIILASEVVDSSEVGSEIEAKLFRFTPATAGRVYWVDRRTVEFRPETRWKSGTRYQVEFFLSKIMEVPGPLSTLAYSFQTIPQNFEVSVTNMTPYEMNDLKRQKIDGVVAAADAIEGETIEKLFNSRQDGKTLPVQWVHAEDGLRHHFTIGDVERKADRSNVTITLDNKDTGAGAVEEQNIEIPSLNEFKLMRATVVQAPTQQVVLQFSDPLRLNQNLTGLITLDGSPRLDFDIRDNLIIVYPSAKLVGEKKLRIETAVRNAFGRVMTEVTLAEVIFEQLAPAVRFTGRGSILPSSNGLVLPFEAVNLNAVDVTVFKIYEKNILQFLQVNNVDGNQELYRVGKRMIKKKISLATAGVVDFGKWNRFTLNLADIIQPDPGAIYQIKLTFKKGYSTYACAEGTDDVEDMLPEVEEEVSDYDGYYEDDYYYFEGYDWRERDNPCHVSYYTANRFVRKNILASDLGLTAKRGDDGNTAVFVTDIRTSQPISGVEIELFDFQQRSLGKSTTSADGKASVKSDQVPFFAVARKDAQRGYLKLGDGESLSLSSFAVEGQPVQKGLKGFLYGDRGVWRPGDSLHLTFILEDKGKQFPDNHPVVFELQNPFGQIVTRMVRSSSENGFYSFATATDHDAPTGNWTGRIKAGAFNLTQILKIETIKPNRLKINLDFGTKMFTGPKPEGVLNVNWLHGAPGRNLKAEFEMLMGSVPTTFPEYKEFTFDDESRAFYAETQPAFEGYTDASGKARVGLDLSTGTPPPGFLQVVLRGKVYEESGNFSVDRISVPYSPYESYVGVKTPEGEKYSGVLYLDQKHPIEIVTVDAAGKPVSRNNVTINLYKLNWRWWWDNSSGGISNYVNGAYSQVVRNESVRTVNGKATHTLQMSSADHEYGRYYLRVCDPVSGHCTGRIIYADEPGWYSRMRGDAADAPNVLFFSTDKTDYKPGDQVKVTIPTPAHGRALVSIENGTGVLQTHWIEAKEGETQFTFQATPEMTPNVYVNVSLLQPHDQTLNELPVRLYGVKSVSIVDPETRLEPVIAMADELEPGKPVTIRISEKNKRRMTYTIAVVDEGLLDITKFQTPKPWDKFYAKEALGVRTWDIFDHVIGAFGSRLERVLTIGGDADLEAKEGDPRANRFKPVVRCFGPFTYDGKQRAHTFIMPEYIGSVKTMVVAGYEGAYGSAERVTPVRKPLMVLATLPRVLGPGERVSLPVTLFTSGNSARDVQVGIKVNGPVQLSGRTTETINMPATGEQTVNFDIAVANATGVATVEVTATSGNLTSTDKIEIQVRNPNLPETRVAEGLLEAGQQWETTAEPFGIAGSNSALLEVSNIPPVNLGSRLRYLIQYPYGCVEQTTSAVFPQLFVESVKVLTDPEKTNIQRNVNAGIQKLKDFAMPDGGFSYWPGADQSDVWGTSYAGHFLIEASRMGYYVPEDMISKWKRFQRNKSEEWRRNEGVYNNDLQQAYRLYTLALAGSPELGAMNRLREDARLSTVGAWMLAAAYARISQPEAARKLIAGIDMRITPYRELGYSYGSDLRDRALVLETLVLLNEKTKAYDLLKEISAALSNSAYWMSTQETAMCLKAVAAFAGMEKRGDLTYTYSVDGKATRVVSALPISQISIELTARGARNVQVTNGGSGTLFTRVILEGTPAIGNETDAASNVNLSVRYTTLGGDAVDVTELEQGTEFMAEVTVRHTGMRSRFENMALKQIFPSGWEITNLRLTDDENAAPNDEFDYQDIRDDRVYTHFSLPYNAAKTFRVRLTATYTGEYYLPAVVCEAMYDRTIYARERGRMVRVTKAEIQ